MVFEENAFNECNSIDTFEISSKAYLEIGNMCFNNSKKLITFNTSCKQIIFGSNCFNNCSSLSHIDCKYANHIQSFENSFNGKDPKEFLKCPSETPLKLIENRRNSFHQFWH